MEIIPENQVTKRRIEYFGKGGEFALIYFKNIILTFLTLGIYYPWAKVEILNYHYQSSELEGSRFTFHATGKEVFRGFIKIYIMLILLYAFLLFSLQTENKFLGGLALVIFYLFFLMLFPLAIHGAMRYRSSRSSWKGIHFKYLGDRTKFFWLFMKGYLFSILTLGIYISWFQVDVRKYIFDHLKFGDISFKFKGEGIDLFWINLKFILLIYITLGIYSFWYYKNLYKFYIENTSIMQNGKKLNFSLDIKVDDVFGLLVVNFLLIVFTLGLALPWVMVRTLRFFFRFTVLHGDFDADAIQQANIDDYGDATGDDFLDFLDFDLL